MQYLGVSSNLSLSTPLADSVETVSLISIFLDSSMFTIIAFLAILST